MASANIHADPDRFGIWTVGVLRSSLSRADSGVILIYRLARQLVSALTIYEAHKKEDRMKQLPYGDWYDNGLTYGEFIIHQVLLLPSKNRIVYRGFNVISK